MDWAAALFAGLGLVMREAALFAGAGFLILGLGDLLVDLIWIGLALSRLGRPRPTAASLPPPERPGLIAVFVPAWDESSVIGDMLRGAVAAFGAADWRLYAGCYPNDPATIARVWAAAAADARVRLVVGRTPGPTTKADCLNRLWEALLADEAADGRRAKAVVLHDAEDVVHAAELAIFDRLIESRDFVQLPVVPLIDPRSRWVAGHYADEFAEAHGKELVVREALGAALPSAGVGCAFSRDALARIAERARGLPFDAASLTEDYELGLKVREAGGQGRFVRIAAAGGELVATREYFPGTFTAAVAQKARWMTGIALAGWDRLGWSGGLAERWMRLRDRQSLLAALLLFAGYFAALLWLLVKAWEGYSGLAPAPLPAALSWLLIVNTMMLAWRMAMRFGFVARAYGWREGLRAIPRTLIANAVTILAAATAVARYRTARRTGRLRWDKTAHIYPAAAAAE